MAKKSKKHLPPAAPKPASKNQVAPGGPVGKAFNFSDQKGLTLLCVLLFGLVVWVFFPSLHGDFLFFDDSPYVVNNSHVNSGFSWANTAWAFSTLYLANWHPVTWLSYMFDYQFYGSKPEGLHLTNVLLHGINSTLVFLVLRKLTGATWRSFLVAILFGLHPLRVESVAWISERKDVLSLTFWMLTLWAYACFAEESRKQSHKAKLFYGLELLFFSLGLMSKTMLVTLPCVLLLLDFWPLERWRQKNKWSLLLEKLPLLLLAFLISKIAYIAQQRGGFTLELAGLSLGDRVGNALISYCRYLGKFFWPVDLCTFYPHPGHWPLGPVLLAGSLLLVISILVFWLRQRRPYLLVGWFWYLGTLVPVIGLVQLSSQSIADRYTYIPMIGVALLLVWGLYELTKQWQHQVVIQSSFAIIVAIVLVARTRQEIPYWQNDVTLWSRAIAVTENNYVAHNCLGIVLGATDPDRALAEFQEAVRIHPAYFEAQRSVGSALLQQGHLDEAILHLQAAWDINPTDSRPQYGLAIACYQKGNVDEAIFHFQKALSINPDSLDYLNDLAMLLAQKNRFAEAVPLLKEVCDLQTNNPNAFNSLGIVLIRSGQFDEAISSFQKAVKLAPDSSELQNNLAAAINAKAHPPTSTNQNPAP
jgi:Flp pilus assembly protein TadD